MSSELFLLMHREASFVVMAGAMTYLVQHDYQDGCSYPYSERLVYDRHDNYATRQREKLYSDSLLAISRDADYSLEMARRRMLHVDPCRAYGVLHGHPEQAASQG